MSTPKEPYTTAEDLKTTVPADALPECAEWLEDAANAVLDRLRKGATHNNIVAPFALDAEPHNPETCCDPACDCFPF
jgi:hypothetical protein